MAKAPVRVRELDERLVPSPCPASVCSLGVRRHGPGQPAHLSDPDQASGEDGPAASGASASPASQRLARDLDRIGLLHLPGGQPCGGCPPPCDFFPSNPSWAPCQAWT